MNYMHFFWTAFLYLTFTKKVGTLISAKSNWATPWAGSTFCFVDAFFLLSLLLCFFFHDFFTFSDASRPQESFPSNGCLNMHSLKLTDSLCVVETEMVKINFNLSNSHVFISNKIHLIENN